MTKALLLIFNEKAYLFRVGGGEGSMEKNKRKRDPFY